MTLPVRHPAQIATFGGTFASQQLAFAHLLDEADRRAKTVNLDTVEVMQGECLGRRLDHYFDPSVRCKILDALGTDDTCILLTDADALPHRDTEHLRWLGLFGGHLVRAQIDREC